MSKVYERNVPASILYLFYSYYILGVPGVKSPVQSFYSEQYPSMQARRPALQEFRDGSG